MTFRLDRLIHEFIQHLKSNEMGKVVRKDSKKEVKKEKSKLPLSK